MSGKIPSLVAAAALLASVGVANAAENAAAKAEGPVTLTDNQLDEVTAGDAASQTAFLLSTSTAELNNLLTISNNTLSFLNGFSAFFVTP